PLVVLLGLGELDEVPNGPRDDVLVRLEVAAVCLAELARQGTGEVASDRRLFGNDERLTHRFTLAQLPRVSVGAPGSATDREDFRVDGCALLLLRRHRQLAREAAVPPAGDGAPEPAAERRVRARLEPHLGARPLGARLSAVAAPPAPVDGEGRAVPAIVDAHDPRGRRGLSPSSRWKRPPGDP